MLIFTLVTCRRQTVSWLSETPPVLEECARSATQPQLLKILLQHQVCLGHLETAGIEESLHRIKEALGNSNFLCFL